MAGPRFAQIFARSNNKMEQPLYNTSMICTYHTDSVFEPTDDISEEERQFVRECVYRQEFLNAFFLEDFVEADVGDALQLLSRELVKNEELRNCMTFVAGRQLLEESPDKGCTLLFSFDWMHAMHPCVCEWLLTGEISRESIAALRAEIGYDVGP